MSIRRPRKMSIIATCVPYSDHEVYRTLAESTHLARKVRMFNSRFNGPDLAAILSNMTSLRSLKLVVDANSMGVLSNYTCSPVSILTTDISKSVTFTGNVLHTNTEPESIDATCLPNLTTVTATFSWLYIIPGRPISEVTGWR